MHTKDVHAVEKLSLNKNTVVLLQAGDNELHNMQDAMSLYSKTSEVFYDIHIRYRVIPSRKTCLFDLEVNDTVMYGMTWNVKQDSMIANVGNCEWAVMRDRDDA